MNINRNKIEFSLYFIPYLIMSPKKIQPSYVNFDSNSYKWKPDIDYRLNPEKYHIGKGEQGVLICQPYKNEIGPYWRFKTSEIATKSSLKIYSLFLNYLDNNDFIGADMCRKYLQMGFTRARRYANYKGGRKWLYTEGTEGTEASDNSGEWSLKERGTGDPEKIISATIFYEKWMEAEKEPRYSILKKEWHK